MKDDFYSGPWCGGFPPGSPRDCRKIVAVITEDGNTHWWSRTSSVDYAFSSPELELGFWVILRGFQSSLPIRQVIDHVLTAVKEEWFRASGKLWAVDLRLLAESFGVAHEVPWLRGTCLLDPVRGGGLELRSHDPVPDPSSDDILSNYELLFRFSEAQLKERRIMWVPTEIDDSLSAFHEEHPDSRKAGFVMMRFGQTRLHREILEAIRKCLSKHGMEALRADDREYHSDLFLNIQTYMHGCDFGIAVIERLEAEDFNPNVSLEVGYMMAAGKPVCLLKDKTLKSLQTDLVGKLYKPFDPQNPSREIESKLSQWLRDKSLIEVS